MEIEKFKEDLKATKQTTKQTAQIGIALKLSKYGNTFKIRDKNQEGIVVKTDKEYLTVFEVALLYSVYHKNQKPADYAGFHRCVAGKEFIEGIKYIGHLVNRPAIYEESIYGD